MKVLVTGGGGFIGSFITDELVRRGHEVVVYDAFVPQVHPEGQRPDYLNADATYIEGNVCDYDAFKKVVLDGFDVIYHKASAVGVGQSQYEIKLYSDSNVSGTANLLDIVVNNRDKHSIKKMVIAASMSSYGEGRYDCAKCGIVSVPLRAEAQMEAGDWELHCPTCNEYVKPVPTDEPHHQNCNSIYAITKKVQEDMMLNIGYTYQIPTVALRYFNVYGPRQSLSNPYTGVAAIFMSRIKNDHAPVVYEDGCQTRDFVSVHDVVQANMLAMETDGGDYQSFNIGSGAPMKIKDIASVLAKLYGKDIEPAVQNKFRKGDVRHCYADITRARAALGFEPKISFEQGMSELIEWSRTAESVDHFEKANAELKAKGLV